MNLLFVSQLLSLIQYLLIDSFLLSTINALPIDHKLLNNKHKLSIDDLAITIKTTHKNHGTRLIDILDTWLNESLQNTYFITDKAGDQLNERLNGHLIATNCGQGHNHRSLNCKLQKELEILAQINAKWSCHFDDDNYVNIPQLLKTLSLYDHTKPDYIGRPSINELVRIGREEFWFGTGGAGFCLSRSLMHQIYPYISQLQQGITPGFVAPDDVTLGYLITSILEVPLTIEPTFHSHLHKLTSKQMANLHEQSTLGPIDSISLHLHPLNDKDKQLFYTLHCHISPNKCSTLLERLQKR